MPRHTLVFLGTLLISLLLSANMYYPCLIYNIFQFNNFVSEQLIIIAVTEWQWQSRRATQQCSMSAYFYAVF